MLYFSNPFSIFVFIVILTISTLAIKPKQNIHEDDQQFNLRDLIRLKRQTNCVALGDSCVKSADCCDGPIRGNNIGQTVCRASDRLCHSRTNNGRR
ncbi:unnamed protein product [Adineta ricciae]|uniref:Uncharacterized protein n=1 Tax=Adineta ricciae TaxID=249248 RepID=A0A815UGL8_ADIRI|nr:unnamed protein product [Adineta ricciae]CAF1515624.1 unnamed protein product [Adineta ricciae]